MGNIFGSPRKELLNLADPVYYEIVYTEEEEEYDDVYGGLASLGDVEIDRRRVFLRKRIGAGTFGEVFHGFYKKNRKMRNVAIKVLHEDSRMSEEQFLNEARTMRELNHPNIVQLYGVCRDKRGKEPILIITEFMNRGSLKSSIKRDRGMILNTQRLTQVAKQITCGMNYLAQSGFVHRDLRTANVLVNTKLEVKVADFGLARLVDVDGVHSSGVAGSCFPIAWTAPEARRNRKFTSQSDVYSFGCLLYEMITYGNTPLPNMNEHVIKRPKPRYWSRVYFDVMKQCLDTDPDVRPTFDDLETWFQSNTF